MLSVMRCRGGVGRFWNGQQASFERIGDGHAGQRGAEAVREGELVFPHVAAGCIDILELAFLCDARGMARRHADQLNGLEMFSILLAHAPPCVLRVAARETCDAEASSNPRRERSRSRALPRRER